MLFTNNLRKNVLLMIVTLFIITALVSAQTEIIDLQFKYPPAAESDTFRTLQSLIKIQGTGQFCEDGLYLMTHFGDREAMFQKENKKAIDNPLIDQTWRHCSVFSATAEDRVIMGRNWDNQNVGSISVNLYHPLGGYSSISFSRSIDMGFGHKDLEQHKSSMFGSKLLLAPFYAMDGINEHGLAVAVAANKVTTVEQKNGSKLICLTFLIRKILDQTKTIEEAVDLADKFIPFDINQNTLSSHLIVTDSSGRSVVLEYDDEQWKKAFGQRSWQIMTTKPVYHVSDKELRERCWRYQTISEKLETLRGDINWKSSMKILQDVTQIGTTWSVVYSLKSKELYFSVYQNWDKIYHVKVQ